MMKPGNANGIPLHKNLAMGKNPATGNKVQMPQAPMRLETPMKKGGKPAPK